MNQKEQSTYWNKKTLYTFDMNYSAVIMKTRQQER